MTADGTTLWRGEAPRHLGQLINRWSLEVMPGTG
jgi:hypothetical protein